MFQFAPLIASAVTAAAGISSAKQTSDAQRSANQTNVDMTRGQMEFQERMSSTAHQREVVDLKAAGLNPVLSANAGASSPSGSLTHVEPAPRDWAGATLSSAKSVTENMLSRSMIKTQESQQKLNEAQTLASTAASAKTLAEKDRIQVDTLAAAQELNYNKWRGSEYGKIVGAISGSAKAAQDIIGVFNSGASRGKYDRN